MRSVNGFETLRFAGPRAARGPLGGRSTPRGPGGARCARQRISRGGWLVDDGRRAVPKPGLGADFRMPYGPHAVSRPIFSPRQLGRKRCRYPLWDETAPEGGPKSAPNPGFGTARAGPSTSAGRPATKSALWMGLAAPNSKRHLLNGAQGVLGRVVHHTPVARNMHPGAAPVVDAKKDAVHGAPAIL